MKALTSFRYIRQRRTLNDQLKLVAECHAFRVMYRSPQFTKYLRLFDPRLTTHDYTINRQLTTDKGFLYRSHSSPALSIDAKLYPNLTEIILFLKATNQTRI
jgi:hypothetical protein